MNIRSIRFNGYKSFSKDTNVEIMIDNYITLLIGKNNCGKSSCLDAVEACISNKKEIPYLNNINELNASFYLDVEHIESGFGRNTMGGQIQGSHFAYGVKFINNPVYVKVNQETGLSYKTKKLTFKEVYNDFFPVLEKDSWNRVARSYLTDIQEIEIRRVNADRNIIPEPDDNDEFVGFDGSGATNLLRKFVNHSEYDEKVVEHILLSELNKIMMPESKFTNIRIQQIQNNHDLLWEIFLEENGERYALSKSGSGLKTILLMLINLHVVPLLKEYRNKKIIYAFEELENNLHPSIQKRVFEYLYEFAKNTDVRILLTTHSHIAINTYFEKEKTALYHIVKTDGKSTISKIKNRNDEIAVLDDLSVKASDLFQANGIIWVEGPSDKIYINHWLKIFCDNKYIEGSHYQFLYYGGRNLSHYSTEDTKDLINVLKTNRNAIIVMDSDKKASQTRINDTKKRVKEEFEKNNMICWVTKGREIENYLPTEAINNLYKVDLPLIGQFEKFPEYIDKVEPNFTQKKVLFAKKVKEYLTKENSENILDLKEKVEILYQQIVKWNK